MNVHKTLAVVPTLAIAVITACASATTGVKWEPKAETPELPSRGDGCYVEVYELGKEPPRPHQTVGVLTLRLTQEELRSGGGEGVAQRFKKAACEYGVFLVKDIKAYPDTTRGGVEYEAKGAVYLDEDGRPILMRSGNESASSEPAAGADAATGEAPTDDSAAP